MRSLIRKDQTPPVPIGINGGEGFRFQHKETLHWSCAVDYWTWESKIKEHRRANELPIEPNLMAIAEDQLCSTLPPELCTHAHESTWVNRRFTLGDLRDGMKAFASLMAGGFQFVSQEEADRRAYICSSDVQFNKNVIGCGTCHKIAGMVVGDVAKRKTKYDDKLKACMICGCVNAVQVHFPMSALDTTDTPEKQAAYPSFCWKKKGSEAYRE